MQLLWLWLSLVDGDLSDQAVVNVLRDPELVVDGQLFSVQNTQITTIVARVLLWMSTLKKNEW